MRAVFRGFSRMPQKGSLFKVGVQGSKRSPKVVAFVFSNADLARQQRLNLFQQVSLS